MDCIPLSTLGSHPVRPYEGRGAGTPAGNRDMTCAARYNRVGTEELRLLMPREDYSPAKKRLSRKGTCPPIRARFTHPRKHIWIAKAPRPYRASKLPACGVGAWLAMELDPDHGLGPRIRLPQRWISDRIPCGGAHQCLFLSNDRMAWHVHGGSVRFYPVNRRQ